MHPINATLRRAEEADGRLLLDLARTTYVEGFLADLRPADAARQTAGRFAQARILEELGDPAVLTLLVEDSGVAIGYAQLWLDSVKPAMVGGRAAELRRIYVLREYFGTGSADALMEAIGRAAETHSVDTVWLGVSADNARAIRFYSKWGFQDIGSHACLSDGSLDRVMAAHPPLRRLAA
ncbi:MAG: GNAT family N-acetyltransferase [Gemmatimonadaceae bacterium]